MTFDPDLPQPVFDDVEPLPEAPTSFPNFVDQPQVFSDFDRIVRQERAPRKGGCMWMLPAVITIGLVLLLIVLALLLPPVSLFGLFEESGTDKKDTEVGGLKFLEINAQSSRVEKDGLTIEAAPDALGGATYRVSIVSALPDDYLHQSVPETGWSCDTALPDRPLASRVYSLMQSGTAPARLSLEVKALPELSGKSTDLVLYAWNLRSKQWDFLPAHPAELPGILAADLTYLPPCVAIFRDVELARRVSVVVAMDETFSPDVLEANVRVNPAGLHPMLNGALNGALPSGIEAGQGYDVLPLISNFDASGVIDVGTVSALLENPALRSDHAQRVAAFILGDPAGYAGVVIDYRGIPATLRTQYSAFLSELGGYLEPQNRVLSVVVPAATLKSSGVWNTGGYDWKSIGQAANEVVILPPAAPSAFAVDGDLDHLVAWAVTQVDRSKLWIDLSALSQQDEGGISVPVALDAALSGLGSVTLDLPDPLAPGQTVTASLSGTAQIAADNSTHTPYVTITGADGSPLRTIWITDPAALAFRLSRAASYNLGGVMVRDLLSPGAVPGLLDAIIAYRVGQSSEMPAFDSAVAWTVRAGDTVVTEESVPFGEPFSFELPADQPSITVEASMGGVSLGSQAVEIGAVQVTPSPEPEVTAEATVEVEAPTPTAEPTAAEAPVEAASALTPDDRPLPTVDAASLAAPAVSKLEVGGHIAQFNATSILTSGRMHLKWVKIDVMYMSDLDPQTLKSRIDETQGNGFKVLLSVMGLPTEITDVAAYVDGYAAFVGGLASLKADGIEIWNGMNDPAYFPGDAALYTRLLAFSTSAIKTANPATLVITGGLVPANDETGATPAADYYAALAQAGAANYADCIGVRYIEGASSPSTTSGDARGDAADFYLPALTDAAFNAFAGARSVCYTDIGYLATDGFGPLPAGYDWAQNTTSAQQGQWLSEAYAQAVQSGHVRLMVIYNIDFTTYDSTSVAGGYAIIRPGGLCPACDVLTPVLEEK